jgi:uncharacterized lipoprotein YddW (UPF0748 family)
LLALLVLPAALPARAQSPTQLRALWVDAFNSGIKSPEQVAQLVADARRGGFNALVVQVRRRGDAYYQSAIEPRSQDHTLAPAPYDPLRTLLDAAHAQGIEVHAWLATLSIWKQSLGEPAAPEHVYWRHGPGVAGTDNWTMLGVSGETSSGGDTWIDPGHPAAVGYTTGVVRDLLLRYADLDGLHLDLVRYPGPNFGYNPVSIARFNERYGRAGWPDPNDPAWAQWRRDQVSGLVRRIYLEAAQVAPRVRVSAAVIAIGAAPTQVGGWERSDPYAMRLQDWRAWLAEGIVDSVLVMNYDRDWDAAQRSWFRAWVDWETGQGAGRSVVVGHGAWLNSVAGTLDQVGYALGAGAAGVAAYAYSDLSSDTAGRDEVLDALRWGPFVQPAATPPMPWKDAYGTLMGHLAQLPLPARDGVAVQLRGPVERTLVSDGGGWFGAVDLPPGWYSAAVALPDGGAIMGAAEVWPGAGAVVQWQTAAVGEPQSWLPLVVREQ